MMDADWNSSILATANWSSVGEGGDGAAPPDVDDDALPYINFMNVSRFWIQRVLVPIIVFIGVLGNVVTAAVLTRRRMRSSTNVYLTALAASDLLYLLFIFFLSLEHYSWLPGPFRRFYWQYKRFGLWLTDAASSTSVWLTVSFTVERYIAVCHPMRGKVLCTESRARRVTALVYALCFLATATTPFEWETRIHPEEGSPTAAPGAEGNATTGAARMPTALGEPLLPPENASWPSSGDAEDSWRYVFTHSELGRDETYRAVFYWFTSVTFVFLPLILLFVFNSFLIHSVHTSRRRRFKMTQGEQSESSQNQENKITITLIAVVILFVVCQLPTASILIYDSFAPKTGPSQATDALTRGLGNIFNFLVAINAASNFLLYCALSGKYRRTFVRTFAPCWAKRWRYFQSTRRRTSIRERSSSEGSSGALVRKRVRRKGPRSEGGRRRKDSGESYYLTTNSDKRPPQGRGIANRAPLSEAPLPLPGGADAAAAPPVDRNGGVHPRLERHTSEYGTRDKQESRPAAEFLRTRSLVSRGRKASPSVPPADNTSTPAAALPPTAGEDSALLVATGGGSICNAADGESASGRVGTMLSRVWRRRPWQNPELGTSSSAARITVTNGEAESGGTRTTV